MKRLIALILVVLMAGSLAGPYYYVQYGSNHQGYPIYWVVNNSQREIYCEVFGDRGYYEEFWVGASRNSRAYYLPNEKIVAECE